MRVIFRGVDINLIHAYNVLRSCIKKLARVEMCLIVDENFIVDNFTFLNFVYQFLKCKKLRRQNSMFCPQKFNSLFLKKIKAKIRVF